jgi:SAM-dependent methyltransferase
MTTTTSLTQVSDPAAVDEVRVEEFLERVFTDFAGAATTVMTVVGDRLGLYQALAGAGPVTAAELADTTGLYPRLVTEWLASQVVSEYVTYHPDTGRYQLPAEHAAVLSEADSPAYLVAAAEVIAGQFLGLDRLEHAFRTDGGIHYADQPGATFHGIERFFRTAYLHELADNWFPAVPGLVDALGKGARVADVGCGHGFATLLVASTWPSATVTGFDFHEQSIATARAKAIEAGSPDNVSFRVSDAAEIGPGPFDVVVFFDALHDLGDPPAALRRAHEVLADDGILVAVEPWSVDRLEDAIGNPSARIDFSASTSVCTPTSLAQPGRYGLGTQGGPARRIALLREAGFKNPTLAADTGYNLVLAATR